MRFSISFFVVLGVMWMAGCDLEPTRDEQAKIAEIPYFVSIPMGSKSGLALTDGDFNGDKQKDIIVAAKYPGLPNARLFFIKNLGQARFAEPDSITEIETTPDGSMDLTSGDMDNDGDRDLLLAVKVRGVNEARVYEFDNLGNGTFSEPRAIFGVPMLYNTGIDIASADYDRDGDKDVILGAKTPGDNLGRFFLFLNDGKGNFRAGIEGDPIPGDVESPDEPR